METDGHKILLIDDEPRFRKGLTDIFQGTLPSGWSFSAPETLEEAIYAVGQDSTIRLVLVDHSLSSHAYQELKPDMRDYNDLRGREVCNRIRAIRKDLLLVAFSKGNNGSMREFSQASFDHKQSLLDAGAVEIRRQFVDFIRGLIESYKNHSGAMNS